MSTIMTEAKKKEWYTWGKEAYKANASMMKNNCNHPDYNTKEKVEAEHDRYRGWELGGKRLKEQFKYDDEDIAEADGKDENDNLYTRAPGDKKIIGNGEKVDKAFHYLCNWDKKIAIDLDDVEEISPTDYFKIHPLPLLTCEGNGRGGGDFRGDDDNVGAWARDRLSLEKEIPEGFGCAGGYTFVEND